MGEGDLGTRYPSSNPAFKDLSSLLMLESVVQTLVEKKFGLVNLDTVICAQAPKLAPYMKADAGKSSSSAPGGLSSGKY